MFNKTQTFGFSYSLLLIIIALPLFLFLALSRTNFQPKASSLPPTLSPLAPSKPISVNDSFDTAGILDATKWGWASTEGEVTKLNGTLSVSVVGGKQVSIFPRVDSKNLYIAGDFEASVDTLGTTSGGSQELRFINSFSIKRNFSGGKTYIEAWERTSAVEGTLNKKLASAEVPEDAKNIKISLKRSGGTAIISYTILPGGSPIVLSETQTPYDVSSAGTLYLITQNTAPSSAVTTAQFDNFEGKVTPASR